MKRSCEICKCVVENEENLYCDDCVKQMGKQLKQLNLI